MSFKMDERKIVLGTSLAPFNIEKQVVAVDTWINNGFQVISCNTKSEINILKKHFDNTKIEFVEASRDASALVGKPLPYIQDILDEVGKRTNGICGYINSDIMLYHMSEEIYEYIEQQAKNALLFVRRNEISSVEDIEKLNFQLHFDGIDMFFIDKELVKDFYDDGFFVQSAWDLCLLTKCKLKGIQIKELMNPIAYHLKHPLKWDFKTSNFLVGNFWEKYYGKNENGYESELDLYYNLLFAECERICYCRENSCKCMFVLTKKNEETKKSLEKQTGSNIDIRYDDSDKEKYDYVFYVKDGTIFDEIYCKWVVFVMEEFKVSELDMGATFISRINDRWMYNELNRSIGVLYQVNEECELFTKVKKLKYEKNVRKIYYPISYRKIEIEDDRIVDGFKIAGDVYLMPAGIRASEWYERFCRKLNQMEVVGFLDNNPNKKDTSVYGKKVYSVDILADSSWEPSVVVASKYYNKEIKEQLSQLIEKRRIIDASYVLWAEVSGKVYYFNLDKYKVFCDS